MSQSENISIGDLAVAIAGHPCCGKSDLIGHTGSVTHIIQDHDIKCDFCGHRYPTITFYEVAGERFQRAELKKINPPTKEISTTSSKELENV